MAIKQLGVRVLTKIEGLISEIDKPNKAQQNKKKNNTSFQDQQIQNMTKDKYYNKLSNTYAKRQKSTFQVLKDNAYKEQQKYQQYRVTNKHTINILKQQQKRLPIHERVDFIMHKKNTQINLLKNYYHNQEIQSMRPIHQSSQSVRKFNESQLQQYRNELDHKNRERIQRSHIYQLKYVNRFEEMKLAPAINKSSRSLSNQRNLTKNYSDNVFKRLSQYVMDRNDMRIQRVQKRTEQEGGFHPNICEKSRQIVSMSRSKRSLMNKSLNNSHQNHCEYAKQINYETFNNSPHKANNTSNKTKGTLKLQQLAEQDQNKPRYLANTKYTQTNISNQGHKTASPFKKQKINSKIIKQQVIVKSFSKTPHKQHKTPPKQPIKHIKR